MRTDSCLLSTSLSPYKTSSSSVPAALPWIPFLHFWQQPFPLPCQDLLYMVSPFWWCLSLDFPSTFVSAEHIILSSVLWNLWNTVLQEHHNCRVYYLPLTSHRFERALSKTPFLSVYMVLFACLWIQLYPKGGENSFYASTEFENSKCSVSLLWRCVFMWSYNSAQVWQRHSVLVLRVLAW